MTSFKWIIGVLWIFIIVSIAESVTHPIKTVIVPLDCRQASIQSGVPVRRNSDGRITRVDVCGAADGPVDMFRDIPYEAHCEEYDHGKVCY